MANTQQISAKQHGLLTWSAADTNRRIYAPSSSHYVYWDTGALTAANTSYLIPTTGYYWFHIALSSCTVAGNCLVGIVQNDTTLWHEVTTTITLGTDADHKAGAQTEGLFSANAGDTFKMFGWHSGGGTCTLTFTCIRYLL